MRKRRAFCVTVCVLLLIILLAWPRIWRHQSSPEAATICARNLRFLGTSLLLFAQENGGVVPKDATSFSTGDPQWAEDLVKTSTGEKLQFLKASLKCPLDSSGRLTSYSMGRCVRGRKLSDIVNQRSNPILLYEDLARHRGKRMVLYFDGSVALCGKSFDALEGGDARSPSNER